MWKTSSQYKCTENQFTVQVYRKPVYSTSVQYRKLVCSTSVHYRKLVCSTSVQVYTTKNQFKVKEFLETSLKFKVDNSFFNKRFILGLYIDTERETED